MCYDKIDKSGLCDSLHPALVTYKLELTENGKEACTDCSEDNEEQTGGVSAQESSEEAGCHCQVNFLQTQQIVNNLDVLEAGCHCQVKILQTQHNC